MVVFIRLHLSPTPTPRVPYCSPGSPTCAAVELFAVVPNRPCPKLSPTTTTTNGHAPTVEPLRRNWSEDMVLGSTDGLTTTQGATAPTGAIRRKPLANQWIS